MQVRCIISLLWFCYHCSYHKVLTICFLIHSLARLGSPWKLKPNLSFSLLPIWDSITKMQVNERNYIKFREKGMKMIIWWPLRKTSTICLRRGGSPVKRLRRHMLSEHWVSRSLNFQVTVLNLLHIITEIPI